MLGAFLTVGAIGLGWLFWLGYRQPYRRRWLLPRRAVVPVAPGVAVDRQHRHLAAGGRVGETAVAAAAARFAALLDSGRLAEVERELRPGLAFAVQVRALARVGTPAAGLVLERQLTRRLSPDPVEQAWYWADVAAGLRQVRHTSALAAVLRCVDAAAGLPAGYVLAAEALAFPNFPSALRDVTTPLGRAALRALGTVARGCRDRVLDLAAGLRDGLGDRLADVSETAPTYSDPDLTLVMLEAERFYRRAIGWSRHLSGAERELVGQSGFRLSCSATRRSEWLAGAARRLVERFSLATDDERVALLRGLVELRAEVAPLFTRLPDPRDGWWPAAVAALTWSHSPAVGSLLTERAAQWWGCRRLRPRLGPLLAALRGHPGPRAERLLVEVAERADPELRAVAVGALGWWPPYHPGAVLHVLHAARRHADEQVRSAAVAALARLGERAALDEVYAGLKAEEPALRLAAFDRIAREQLSWFWPDVQEAAETPGNGEVGLAAVEALHRLREQTLGPLR